MEASFLTRHFRRAIILKTNKYYIDFCARNGIEYHSVVESVGHEWYTNDGENYQPARQC
jgi:hypothetical protein